MADTPAFASLNDVPGATYAMRNSLLSEWLTPLARRFIRSASSCSRYSFISFACSAPSCASSPQNKILSGGDRKCVTDARVCIPRSLMCASGGVLRDVVRNMELFQIIGSVIPPILDNQLVIVNPAYNSQSDKMPKSKRNKIVPLTKTKKKGKAAKQTLIEKIREAIEEYPTAYVFRYENMRNTRFKELRETVHESSRFFMGSNKVMQVALGREPSTEVQKDLSKLAQMISGSRGLLFTKLPHEEVVRALEEVEDQEFARTGTIATETVTYPAGPLEMFTHDQEPFLRKQGMPTRLNKGVVELVGEFTVCKEGEPLTAEAAQLLRLFGIEMATFRLVPEGRWHDGEFELLEGYKPDEGKEDFEDDGELDPLP
eukprot:jgi/Mesvir1/22641/Mv14076-RA.1